MSQHQSLTDLTALVREENLGQTPEPVPTAEDLALLTLEQIHAINVTPQNVWAIHSVFYPTPHTEEFIDFHGNRVRPLRPFDMSAIINGTTRAAGNWFLPSDREKRRLCFSEIINHYPLRLLGSRLEAMLPPVFFIDPDSRNVAVSGGFGVTLSRDYAYIRYPFQSNGVERHQASGERWKWHFIKHPHVSNDNTLCLGSEVDAYYNAIRRHDFLTCLTLVEGVLGTYNPQSPYVKLKDSIKERIVPPAVEMPHPFLQFNESTHSFIITAGFFPVARSRRSFGPFSLMLSDEELRQANQHPEHFFLKLVSLYTPSAITNEHQKKMALKILPGTNCSTLPEAAHLVGFNVFNGMNQENRLLNAVRVKPSDFPITTELNPNVSAALSETGIDHGDPAETDDPDDDIDDDSEDYSDTDGEDDEEDLPEETEDESAF